MIALRTFVGALASLAACCVYSPSFGAQCTGDCDGSGEVTINELVIGVNIALGNTSLSACPAFDANQDQMVTVNEIIAAVNNALNGCAGPTPAPSATPTPGTLATPTPPPGCGNGAVDFNLGETCDDGNTVDDDGPAASNPCPANCRIAACSPGGTTLTVDVNFAAPPGVDIAGLTVFLRYPDGVVQIPGQAADDQVQNRLSNLPDTAFDTPNDLDFALRVVLLSTDQSPFPPGRLFSVEFDNCRGAAAPTAANFHCLVEDAADTNLDTVTGVTCSVALPALP